MVKKVMLFGGILAVGGTVLLLLLSNNPAPTDIDDNSDTPANTVISKEQAIEWLMKQ